LTPFEVSKRGFESPSHGLSATTQLQDHGKVITDKYGINFAHGVPNYPTSVTFKSYTLLNDNKIEPPSPQLLALHAASAKIAHMSGVVEHLKEKFRDTEPIAVMTSPNAADEFVRALKNAQLQHLTRSVYD